MHEQLTPVGVDPGGDRSANFGGCELPSLSSAVAIWEHIFWNRKINKLTTPFPNWILMQTRERLNVCSDPIWHASEPWPILIMERLPTCYAVYTALNFSHRWKCLMTQPDKSSEGDCMVSGLFVQESFRPSLFVRKSFRPKVFSS